jgi:hypothetical protein
MHLCRLSRKALKPRPIQAIPDMPPKTVLRELDIPNWIAGLKDTYVAPGAGSVFNYCAAAPDCGIGKAKPRSSVEMTVGWEERKTKRRFPSLPTALGNR